MKKRRIKNRRKPGFKRIIVNPNDMTQDRYLPEEEAQARYDAGQLDKDEDSGSYCLKHSGAMRPILPPFLRDAQLAR